MVNRTHPVRSPAATVPGATRRAERPPGRIRFRVVDGEDRVLFSSFRAEAALPGPTDPVLVPARRRALASGTGYSVRLPARDGRPHAVLVRGFALRDAGGGTSVVLEVVSDHAAVATLQQDRTAALESVLSQLPHEINNPLAAIVGAVEVMRLGELPPDLDDELTSILHHVHRVARSVDRVRALLAAGTLG